MEDIFLKTGSKAQIFSWKYLCKTGTKCKHILVKKQKVLCQYILLEKYFLKSGEGRKYFRWKKIFEKSDKKTGSAAVASARDSVQASAAVGWSRQVIGRCLFYHTIFHFVISSFVISLYISYHKLSCYIKLFIE